MSQRHLTQRINAKLRRGMGPFGSVAGGSALGQIALALSLPVTARIYPPADLGAFAVVLAYAQVAAIVITGRLEQVLPRLEAGRRWVATRLVLVTGIALAPVSAIVILALAGRLATLEAVFAGALVASICLYNTGTYALLAERQYRRVAVLRITNGVVTASAQIVFGLLLPEVWVLLATYAAGNVVATLVAVPAVRKIRRVSGGEPARLVIREERLGRFVASVGTGAVLSNLGLALPVVGVSMLFGDAAAGSFWLARRLLMVPTQLLAHAVNEVTYAIAARQSVHDVARMAYGWLRKAKWAALALLVVGTASAPLVPIIVGEGYQSIAWVMVFLSASAAAQLVATSFSNVLLVLRMEVVRTAWYLGRLIGLLVIFVWAQASGASFMAAVGLFAAYTVVSYGVLLWLTFRGLRTGAVTD